MQISKITSPIQANHVKNINFGHKHEDCECSHSANCDKFIRSGDGEYCRFKKFDPDSVEDMRRGYKAACQNLASMTEKYTNEAGSNVYTYGNYLDALLKTAEFFERRIAHLENLKSNF